MNNPAVSVLIPTYNCGAFIGDAINSVLSQSFRDYEIIVLDDGSCDGTGDIMKAFPEVSYYRQEHTGIPKARNKAISLAQGQWIAFLDADDVWLPEKLLRQMEYLSEHPDCKVIYTKVKNFSDIPPENMTEAQTRLLRAGLKQALPTALIHKSLFETVGLFNEAFPFGEDTEWNMRAGISGVDMTCEIPERLYLRRIHENNISSASIMQTDQEKILKIAADVIRQYGKKGQ